MSKSEYDAEYSRQNMRLFSFRLNLQKPSEKALIDHIMKQKNKRQWIIAALRAQMLDDAGNEKAIYTIVKDA